MTAEEKIREAHLQFAESRGLEKTFCPSEVARALFPEGWRDKMELVRKIADHLVVENKLIVLQNGIVKSKLPSKLIGPIRLRKK